MENETGEIFFYYLFTFMGYYYAKKGKKKVLEQFTLAFIYALFVDNTGPFMIGSFTTLVLRERKRRRSQPGPDAPGRCVKWVFCLAFFSILKMIDFNWEFIFSLLSFCSKENLTEVSDR